ncbi:cyanophycin synthetase, partial [Candidatus Gracilibacteria bacterium]|nr:cyanophycin synthetase [Candidatus Gracilibacteria bacterium]
EIAPEIGAKIWIEEEYGYVGEIIFKNGRKHLFKKANFNVNPHASVEIVKDKGYTSQFLRRYGYSVAEGQTFFSEGLNQYLSIQRNIDDGWKYIESIGVPVIIKPNNLSQGVGVQKIENKDEYYDAARKILDMCPVMIIEKSHTGKDYRVVVFDGQIISAYMRIPLSITGDGQSPISELIDQKEIEIRSKGRNVLIDTSDPRIIIKLEKQGLNIGTIIEKGQTIFLLDNANLSTGGESIDVTGTIHPDFQQIAINATKDMGLRLCGVDFMTNNIELPLSENPNYIIIELNSAPGLAHYNSAGETQKKHVKELYKKILIFLSEHE